MTEPKSARDSLRAARSGGGWSRARITFLAVSATLFVAFVVAVREVLLPFVLAVIIAYVLTPLVAWCEKRARMPRSVAILVVYVVTFSLLYTSVAAMAPRIYHETVQLARDAPAIGHNLATSWGPKVEGFVQGLMGRQPKRPPSKDHTLQVQKEPDGSLSVRLEQGIDFVQETPSHWRIVPRSEMGEPDRFSVRDLLDQGLETVVGFVKLNAIEIIKAGQTFVSRVARGIFLTFMTLMVAGYLMHTREAVVGFFVSLPPPRARPSFERLLWRMDRGLSGVVRGQLLICLVNGVLSAIGFWMFGLKYWPILSVIAAVMSLIPIFGSIMSTIPAVLIGLTQDFWTALWVLLWIIGIHQVEANFLNPKIIGVAAKIHPVLVVLALVIGEHFFGLWGALLAVPALSLVQSVFNHYRYESMPDLPADSIPPPPVAPASG